MKPTSSLRKVSLASTLSVMALSGIAFAVASGQSESIAAPPPRGSESAVSVGKSRLDTEQYVIEMKAVGTYKANTEGTVEIAITPKSEYKINDKYPLKFKAADAADGSVKYPKPLLKREDGTFEEKKGSLKVPFIASRAGTAKISGVLSVSVCSEKNCLMEKLDLDLDVQVVDAK